MTNMRRNLTICHIGLPLLGERSAWQQETWSALARQGSKTPLRGEGISLPLTGLHFDQTYFPLTRSFAGFAASRDLSPRRGI